MENQTNTFKQTNGFAMQYGALFGLCGIASLACSVLSFQLPFLSFVGNVLNWGSPFLAAYFTIRFRRAVMVPELGFSFGRGFAFTFLMGAYSTLWVALTVFIYLAYLDNGYIFDAYEQQLLQPEMVAALRQSGMWDMMQNEYGGVTKIVDILRGISPAQYAGSIIYMSLLVAPVFSAIIALVCRKSGNGWVMPRKENDSNEQQ